MNRKPQQCEAFILFNHVHVAEHSDTALWLQYNSPMQKRAFFFSFLKIQFLGLWAFKRRRCNAQAVFNSPKHIYVVLWLPTWCLLCLRALLRGQSGLPAFFFFFAFQPILMKVHGPVQFFSADFKNPISIDAISFQDKNSSWLFERTIDKLFNENFQQSMDTGSCGECNVGSSFFCLAIICKFTSII